VSAAARAAGLLVGVAVVGVAPRPAVAASSCAIAPGGGLTLTNVAAHGGRVVAVGSNGLVTTSTDGGGWRVRRSGAQHDLRGIAWAGAGWVAIGDGGTIVRSLDPSGGRWVRVPGIPSSSFRAIAARPGVVAVGGSNGVVLTSTDGGTTWHAAVSGTTSTLWGGTSSDGTLYLAGQNATMIASVDGLHWRRIRTAPRPTGNPASPRPFLWQIAIGGRRRVAVGDFGAILTSAAEGTLSAATSPTGEILRGAAYGHGRFVVVGSGGVVVSGPGSRAGWRSERPASMVDLRGVAWTGRRFVAVGDEGTVVDSADGRSWRLVTSAMPCALLGVARGAGRLVAVGGDGTILLSADARHWRPVPRITDQDLYAVAHGSGGFVAVGTGGVMIRSRDGREWSLNRRITRLNLHAVAWTGHEYLAGGDLGRVLSSRDGRRWTLVGFPGYHAVHAFAAHGDTIVVAGSGTVARSSGSARWRLQPIGFQHFWTGAAYGAGRFVVIGHNGTALVSTDAGATWTAATTSTAINLDAITWTGTEFVATGQGTAVASRTGTTWQTIPLGSRHSVRALASVGGHLVGVGDQRTIVQIR
jgi:photosystem II stability/assembly factor-like uncharacterized protein